MLVTRTLYGVSFVQRSNYNGNDQHLAGISNMASREGALWTMMRILIGVSLMMAAPNVHCSKWWCSSRWQSRWRLSHFGMSFVLDAASSSQRYGICKRHSCSLFDRRPKQFLWMGILREFWLNLKIVTEMMEDFCRQWVWNPTTSPQLHSLQSKTNQVSNYLQRQPMLVRFKNYPAWN